MAMICRSVLGLTVLESSCSDGIAISELGESFGEPTSTLAPFRHDPILRKVHLRASEALVTGARPWLHHLAIAVEASGQNAVVA